MILHASFPIPEEWTVGPTTKIALPPGNAVVRDPASGVVGRVTHADIDWTNHAVRVVLDVDDDAAVAALRRRPKQLF